MVFKECANMVREVRKHGQRGNKRLVTDLAELKGKKVRGILPKLRNTSLIVVIC